MRAVPAAVVFAVAGAGVSFALAAAVGSVAPDRGLPGDPVTVYYDFSNCVNYPASFVDYYLVSTASTAQSPLGSESWDSQACKAGAHATTVPTVDPGSYVVLAYLVDKDHKAIPGGTDTEGRYKFTVDSPPAPSPPPA